MFLKLVKCQIDENLKYDNTFSQSMCEATGTHTLVVGMHTGTIHLEENLKYLTKLQLNLAIPLLGVNLNKE